MRGGAGADHPGATVGGYHPPAVPSWAEAGGDPAAVGRGGLLSRRAHRRRAPRPGLATLSGAGARSIYQSPPDAMDIATLRTSATPGG